MKLSTHLFLLVLGTVLPFTVLAVFLVTLLVSNERDSNRRAATDRIRALMTAVDAELRGTIGTLQALATSESLKAGDFRAFRREALNVLGSQPDWATIIVLQRTGQQVVNTNLPEGASLPKAIDFTSARMSFDAGRITIGNVAMGVVIKELAIPVRVPVFINGDIQYVLTAAVRLGPFQRLVEAQKPQEGAVLGLVDSTGRFIARKPLAPTPMASAQFMQHTRSAPEGWYQGLTVEGLNTFTAHATSQLSGWSVGIGIPVTQIYAEAIRVGGLLGAGIIAVVALAFTFAYVLGQRIARPVRALIAPALAIAKGESVSIPPLGLKEAEEVAQALVMAREILRQREDERDRAEQAERKMLAAKQVSDEANQAKTHFLANTSHALRTPLNAILGFARVMRNDPEVTVRQIHNLDIINSSGEHLLHLINNVLDMSKIESGKAQLEQTRFDLAVVLNEISSLMHVRALEKGLSFGVVNHPNLPRQVSGDADKLRQVLINLAGNAIKFTQRGSVIVRAEVVRRETEHVVRVRFEVKDTGPGIRKEDSEHVFSLFTQLGDTPASEAGTGLGLAISKQYVELMGGQLVVDSEPGQGATFYFEIPLTIMPGVEIAPAARHRRVTGLIEGQQRFRLLIAEDQPENRLLLRALLEPLGFDLREVHTGREAVAVCEQWQPHLIWMDIRMPDMDGLQATRRIRGTGVNTRIVAVTAHALEEERRAILADGCDDVIRKPYRESEIFEALEKNLGVRFQYAEDQAPAVETYGQLALEQLATLPPALIDELREAVLLLDGRRCREIVTNMDDQRVRDILRRLVNNLQYAELLAALDKVKDERPA